MTITTKNKTIFLIKIMLNKYYYSDILFYSQGILMFYITTSP